jgi:hypothetical protein
MAKQARTAVVLDGFFDFSSNTRKKDQNQRALTCIPE